MRTSLDTSRQFRPRPPVCYAARVDAAKYPAWPVRGWRVRTILKWIGVGMCAVMPLGLSILPQGLVKFRDGFVDWEMSNGLLSATWFTSNRPPLPTGLPTGVTWGHIHPTYRVVWQINVSLWLLVAAIAIPTVVLWYLDRRRPAPGACRCGYDLTGNKSGVCPECGRELTTGLT